MWKFYSILLISLQALLSFQLSLLPLPLSLSTFGTTDNRALLVSPINTSMSDGWIIVYSITPSNWSSIDNNTILPVFSNGTIGVTANFQISQFGYYDFSITISQQNSSTFSNIALSYNSIPQSSQTSTNQSNLTFSITNQYLNSGTQQLAIWLDDSLSLNLVTVSQTVKFESVSVQLYSHPYYHQLYMVTNLSYASLTNLTLFSTHTDLLISFNSNAGDVCFKSLGATTNPANFSSYTSSTNFTELQQFYSYTVSPTNTSILPNTSTGLLMVTVSNISFDCSAIANINFPQGQIFNDGFWTILSIQINPVLEYIETVLSQVKNYSFLYNINLQRLEIRIFNLIFNHGWNIKTLNETTTVTYLYGGICKITLIWYWMTSTTIFCTNTTASDNISQIFINLPDYYLRQPSTNRLHNITLNQSQNQMQYILSNNASVNIKYYQLESKLIVIFNITIDNWVNNLTTNNINITINGRSILSSEIFFISNPMNYVQVYTILSQPLLKNDSVLVSFNSRWNLNTVQGYHNVWNIINAYQVQFLYSQIIPETVKQADHKLSQIFANPLKIVQYYIQGWSFLAFSYFINSLINFQSLICMYYFMSFKNSLHNFRKGIYQALLMIESSSNYEKIIQNIFNKKLDFSITNIHPDPLSLYKNQQKQLNLSQLGYTVQFFNNNIQSIIQILFLIFKLLFIKLISFICFPFLKKIINYILHFWNQFLLVQFVIMSSSISIVFGSYLTTYNYFGFSSHFIKLNDCLNIMSFFLCIISLFLLSLCQKNHKKIQFQQTIIKTEKNLNIENLQNMENIKQNKENIKLFSLNFYKNRILNKTYNKFLDNSLYIIVPFFMAADNTIIFISIMSFIVIYRLIRVIKTYTYYTKGQFLKQIVNKVIWVLFNIIYVFYWLTQIFQIKCDEGVMLKIITICDIAQSVLLLLGVGFEMISTIVQISHNIYRKIKQGISDIKRSNKISENKQITPDIKPCKMEQTKTVIDKNSISKYIKKRKSRLVDVQNRIKIQKQHMTQSDSEFKNSLINKISKVQSINKIFSSSEFDSQPKIGHLTQKLKFKMNRKNTQNII